VPTPRQYGALAGRPWDVVLADLPAVHAAHNDTEHDGVLGLLEHAPRPIDLLLRSLLDVRSTAARPGFRTGRRRSRPPAGAVPVEATVPVGVSS